MKGTILDFLHLATAFNHKLRLNKFFLANCRFCRHLAQDRATKSR